jgi:hypothetical protein
VAPLLRRATAWFFDMEEGRERPGEQRCSPVAKTIIAASGIRRRGI